MPHDTCPKPGAKSGEELLAEIEAEKAQGQGNNQQ